MTAPYVSPLQGIAQLVQSIGSFNDPNRDVRKRLLEALATNPQLAQELKANPQLAQTLMGQGPRLFNSGKYDVQDALSKTPTDPNYAASKAEGKFKLNEANRMSQLQATQAAAPAADLVNSVGGYIPKLTPEQQALYGEYSAKVMGTPGPSEVANRTASTEAAKAQAKRTEVETTKIQSDEADKLEAERLLAQYGGINNVYKMSSPYMLKEDRPNNQGTIPAEDLAKIRRVPAFADEIDKQGDSYWKMATLRGNERDRQASIKDRDQTKRWYMAAQEAEKISYRSNGKFQITPDQILQYWDKPESLAGYKDMKEADVPDDKKVIWYIAQANKEYYQEKGDKQRESAIRLVTNSPIYKKVFTAGKKTLQPQQSDVDALNMLLGETWKSVQGEETPQFKFEHNLMSRNQVSPANPAAAKLMQSQGIEAPETDPKIIEKANIADTKGYTKADITKMLLKAGASEAEAASLSDRIEKARKQPKK